MFIIYYVLFFIYIKYIYTYELYKILSKNKVLNITNVYYISFYCFFLISVNHDYSDMNITIPDKNGIMINYIAKTCLYENIKNNNCYSNQCNIDSECLSNKCYNNYCMFNNNEHVIHCNSIYTNNVLLNKHSSYMYCGIVYDDKCKNNDECSSKICNDGGICNMQLDGPSDND